MPEDGIANSSLRLTVEWSGPFRLDEVLKGFNDGGKPPLYDGPDYGLYQIYGEHILAGADTLLYIGRATHQTFSSRFSAHRIWLANEKGITIYLGRALDRERHLPENDWAVWVRDVQIAECLLIYKYSPNYNSVSVAEQPPMEPYQRVILQHFGQKHRLYAQDVGPDDWV